MIEEIELYICLLPTCLKKENNFERKYSNFNIRRLWKWVIKIKNCLKIYEIRKYSFKYQSDSYFKSYDFGSELTGISVAFP